MLLLADGGLVKTLRFARPRYIGDPINAVRILNDKRVDELVLLDIQATARRRIDLTHVEEIVSEAFMPVAYGGGITTVGQCADLFRCGVEKVVLNTAAVERPELVRELASRFGSQAVVVSIDVGYDWRGQARAYIRGGKTKSRFTPAELARRVEELGAGEILLTSMRREGTYEGYDWDLLVSVSSAVRVPVVAHGGASSVADFARAITESGCSAAAAGSLFVFSAKSGGVLITYPSEVDLQRQLWTRAAAPAGRT